MSRLIDADALIKFIDLGHLRNPLEMCFSERDVVDMIESRPTVDAIPTEWIRAQMCEYPGMESAMWSKLLRIWKRAADT